MRRIEKALDDHELITLRVIGEWWELDLAGTDKPECVIALAERLTQLDLEQEIDYLPREDSAALKDLFSQGGRVPVASFNREHGEVRLMGPGRLEREEPWLDPVSAAEALWYRGFLYRGFDETAEGVIEFYYLPQELMSRIPGSSVNHVVKESGIASLQPLPPPAQHSQPTTDAVDDLTAILAVVQTSSSWAPDLDWSRYLLNPQPDRCLLLFTLAKEMGLIRERDDSARLTRAAVGWLKKGRDSQLRELADAWSSTSWNELFHTPGLVCEGEGWRNDPILARTMLLDVLSRDEDWYSTAALASYVKDKEPDFQRPDGNYDTWYIRESGSTTYLTGYESWDMVEGRLIQFLLEGPCTWLGLVTTVPQDGDTLYRLTASALGWLTGTQPLPDPVDVPLVVSVDGLVRVPYNASRYHRFQAARISEMQPLRLGKPFEYRLTPGSLEKAQEQGISLERVVQFLKEASGRPLPAGFGRALARWAEKGVEARMEEVVVLRVKEAAILNTLRENPKTRDYIGESLGELSAVVRHQAWPKLAAASAALGLLLDLRVDPESP